MVYLSEFKTSNSALGDITITASDKGLTGLWMEGQEPKCRASQIIRKDGHPVIKAAKEWLQSYFAKENPSIADLRLLPEGSEFGQNVWSILCKIPYGEVVTYGDIAREIAGQRGLARMSAQAVGGAVGSNPISIIIPCHRVVGTNNSLTGYGGGIPKKIWLLTHEGIDMSKYFVPQMKS